MTTYIGIEDELRQIAEHSSTTLELSGHEFGIEEGIAIGRALEDNSSITTLNLSGYGDDSSGFGDEGATAIAHALRVNTSITSVDLRGNQIGVDGAVAIGRALEVNSSITTLNLCGNEIGDEGTVAIARALRVNTSITSVDLYDTWTSDEGAEAIASALEVNSSITTVDLDYNPIHNQGATAISGALDVNSSITTLNLCSMYIDDEAVSASIDRALERNRRIGSALPLLMSREAIRRGDEVPTEMALRLSQLPRSVFNHILSDTFGVYPRRCEDRHQIVEDIASGAGAGGEDDERD